MLTLNTIRATGESDLESLMQQLDDKHKALLRDAIKQYGVYNIPDSVWQQIETNVQEGVVSAIILLLMMADDWTTTEIDSKGVPRKALGAGGSDSYVRVASAQARGLAIDTTRTLRDRLIRKVQDQALAADGGVGVTTDAGIDQALDDVFTQSRRQTMAIDTTTQAMSAGQMGAAERAAGDGASAADGRRMTIKLVWHTERDDRVCPRCSPLEGTGEEVWGLVFPSGPGPTAHPNCRCELEPRVVPYFEDSE